MGARPTQPPAWREGHHGLRRWIGPRKLSRQRRRQLSDLEGLRIVPLQHGRQLVDQMHLLPDLLIVLREGFELLGLVRARLQGLEVRMIPAPARRSLGRTGV